MKYVGIATQIRRNNMLSMLLLLLFPVIMLCTVYLFIFLINYFGGYAVDQYGNQIYCANWNQINTLFVSVIPYVIIGVVVWFLIAYLMNTSIIQHATGARALERRDNMRIYNIVENLCMSCGMEMPKINVIDDPMLNAFASGIDKKSYTVTVTTGLMDLLNDEELAGVIGHELTHIRNHDTKLLITSIIFVGIVSTIMGLVIRLVYNMFLFGGGSRRDNDEKGNGLSVVVIMIVALVCTVIAYVFTIITRFAISRKREYMADAGGAELSGNPLALASALRKISRDPGLQNVKREDIAQLFIIHPHKIQQGFLSGLNSLFSTHPSTDKRIQILEQF